MDPLIREWSERVRAAASRGESLQLRGGGTKDFYGQSPQGEVLDTRGFRGVVSYEPTELVITARCGTPLDELQAALAEQGQELPFEPPSFGHGATIGGCVAAGLSGPRRGNVGALRDFVLGTRIIDGRGEFLRFGGQVMKNVAGYDVSRLMAGSLGTLALLAEVSLKVLPKPVAERTLQFELGQATALARLNAWGGRPLPIGGSFWHADSLWLRLCGADAAVEAASRELGGEALEAGEAAALWQDIREHRHPFFAGEEALWRLAVPTDAAALPLEAPVAIEWGGGQRWLRGAQTAPQMRQVAEAAGGHATLFRGGNKAEGVFHPLPPVLARINRRIAEALDPQDVFGRGRIYPVD
ncbi:MAG: glycolate oxidase subunit GlcE [Rhodocyclaceae bacterium]|nr:glycolate oxidase subunit GlcE [Rhodocyclaceae bacterium]